MELLGIINRLPIKCLYINKNKQNIYINHEHSFNGSYRCAYEGYGTEY